MSPLTRPSFDRSVLSDPSWWHWTITIPLLAAHLAGWPWSLAGAVGLCLLVGGWTYLRIGQLRPFPVQVRLAYCGLLLAGLLPYLGWIHWVQLVGTTTMVTVGYCPLARLLRLLPLNRSEPFSCALVWRRMVTDSNAGGLIRWPDRSGAHTACDANLCSLRNRGRESTPFPASP